MAYLASTIAHGNSVEKREKGTFGGLLSSISVFHFYLSVALKLSKEGKIHREQSVKVSVFVTWP